MRSDSSWPNEWQVLASFLGSPLIQTSAFLVKDSSSLHLIQLTAGSKQCIEMIDRNGATCVSSVQLMVVFRYQIEAAFTSTNICSCIVCHVVGLENGFLLLNSALPYNCVTCTSISPQRVAAHAMEGKAVTTNLGVLGSLGIVVFKE